MNKHGWTKLNYVYQHVWVCMFAFFLLKKTLTLSGYILFWSIITLKEIEMPVLSLHFYVFLLKEGRRTYINVGGIDVFILIVRTWLQYNSVVIIWEWKGKRRPEWYRYLVSFPIYHTECTHTLWYCQICSEACCLERQPLSLCDPSPLSQGTKSR